VKYFFRALSFLLLAGGAMVFAGGGGFEDLTGETGLQTAPDARGARLRGVVFVEFYANRFDPELLPVGRAVVRLKRGEQLATFYEEVIPGPFDDVSPSLVQELLTEGLKQQILDRFFPGKSSLEIKLRSFDNVGVLSPDNTRIATSLTCGIDPSQLPLVTNPLDPTQCPFGGSVITVMNVVLAVPGIRPGREDRDDG
jgi:hypothetical protein